MLQKNKTISASSKGPAADATSPVRHMGLGKMQFIIIDKNEVVPAALHFVKGNL
jgi:hypothetical protein